MEIKPGDICITISNKAVLIIDDGSDMRSISYIWLSGCWLGGGAPRPMMSSVLSKDYVVKVVGNISENLGELATFIEDNFA
ncbi:hypothetical protein GWM83_00005 [Candidatus Bathyarchaeota archaeon]|nr:hypothetical protein [Candidatus Bathyarchaeota archaeon]NIR16044.1 hypothetical protein [Desulfobacterales bacterium]NIV67468.1 hypothetical protein [Candidatus Bathyarchaeota archaeon]NIW33941.1 hypothetical protein [Candidatus Bathyarchaeota archaeon]